MAEFPALPLWTDAYLADTSHLRDGERGRYDLMLFLMWRMPMMRFPADDAWLARKFGRSVEVIEKYWKPLMREYFQCDGNWWTHKRLASEWEYLSQKRKQQSDAAKSRWDKEKKSNSAYADRNAPRNAPTPTPIPIKENIQSAAPQTDHLDFEKFWADYPREKNMSKKRALAAWKKLTPEKRAKAIGAVPGYRAYCEKNKSWYHTVHAERFLSHERFEGFQSEPVDEEKLAHAKDWADRYFKRGKYAETYK